MFCKFPDSLGCPDFCFGCLDSFFGWAGADTELTRHLPLRGLFGSSSSNADAKDPVKSSRCLLNNIPDVGQLKSFGPTPETCLLITSGVAPSRQL